MNDKRDHGLAANGSTSLLRCELLRQAMTNMGLTYPMLAKISMIPESTLRKLMHGTTTDPRISTLYPVARALDTSFDDLLGTPRNSAQGDTEAMRAHIEDQQETIDHLRTTLSKREKDLRRTRRFGTALAVLASAVIVSLAVVYIIWDVRNPDHGITAWIRHMFG